MSILCSENQHFLTLPLISRKLMMVERQTIPHSNALVDGLQILGEQLCSFLRGCHATSSLKSVFFTRKVAWSSLIELHGCSWNILKPTSKAKKWGIICLSSISGSLSNLLFTKCSNPLNQYIRSAVYLSLKSRQNIGLLNMWINSNHVKIKAINVLSGNSSSR